MDMQQFEALSGEEQEKLPYSEWPLEALQDRNYHYHSVENFTDGGVPEEDYADWDAVEAELERRKGDDKPDDWDASDWDEEDGDEDAGGQAAYYRSLADSDISRQLAAYDIAAENGDAFNETMFEDRTALLAEQERRTREHIEVIIITEVEEDAELPF